MRIWGIAMTKPYHITPEQALELAKNLQSQGFMITVSEEDFVDFHDAEELAAFANAVLDEVLGEQWQPIETVPVNKSVLMLRLGKHGRCGIADGYKKENGVLVWPYINKEPTHWMQLPNAPKELT